MLDKETSNTTDYHANKETKQKHNKKSSEQKQQKLVITSLAPNQMILHSKIN
jgi:hypothetical protein